MRQQKHRDHWRHYQPPGNNNTNYPPQPSTAAPSIPFLPFDFFGFRDLTSDQIQLPPPNPLHSLPFLFPLPTAAPQPIPQPAPQPTAAAPPPPPPPQAEREYIVISDDEENSEPKPPAPPTTAPNPVMDGSTLETAITIDDNDDDEQVNSGVERPVRSLSTGTRESGSISPVKAENVSEFQDIHQRDGIQIDFDDASSEGTESSSECLFGIAPIMTEEERVMMNTSYEPPPAQASWTLLAGLSLEEKPLAMVKMEQDEADLEQQQLQQQPEIMPASAVKTKIPDDIQLSELLSRIEVYDESVRTLIAEGGPISDPAQPKKLTTRARRRRSPAYEEKKATQIRCRPYVPGALWRDSTWEDWAEFQIGDWLHWPFQEWEQRVIQEVMDAYGLKTRKRKIDGEFVIAEELWAVASNRLPGRRDIDCFRYWQDREVNFKDPYTKPIIISQEIRKKQVATKYEVICRSRLYGRPNPVAVKMAVWSDLRRERIFGGGSADTLAVQLVKMDDESFNVFASSACNSQLEYNMPGNLRVWSSNTDTVTQMEGHKIQVGSAEEGYQDLWTTVTDIKVSHDKRFIYSASHDKSARVWCARKFNLLATLCYHENPVHQLAIRPNTRENIVASGSQDGTAVIWRLHESGNYGDGVVCEIDLDRYPEPNIECLAFGTGPSAQCLFTGVATNERQQMGFIQTFDADTSQEIISFSSMRGAVCDIDISTSGRYIVSGNHSPYDDDVGDGFVHINDIRSPETVIKAKTGHKDVNFVRMSPCERYVASGNPFNEVAVLDIRRPDRHLFVLRHDESIADHLVPINSDMGIAGMHWMSDNPLLITAGGDSSVKLWDTQIGNLVKTYPTSSNVTSLHVDEESLTICAGVAGAQGFVHIFSP